MPTKRRAPPPDAIDLQLDRYRSMRDFNITAEPAGSTKSRKSNPAARSNQYPFVIHKHAASHLHYDFRLGWNGVLKSWAITKGPSYVPADKRLAVQVEDHPMEYGGFEGIIPQGQYGGGTVMLWDQGTWEPQSSHADIDTALRDGHLKFTLHGTKLKGNWALIRMHSRTANQSKSNWLLIKEHDDFERSPDDIPITDQAPNSVLTNRSIDQIAASHDHVWGSSQTASRKSQRRNNATPASTPVSASTRRGSAANKSKEFTPDLTHTPKEELPTFIAPQLAQPAKTPPTSSGWLHELKLDGYRIQARKDAARVQLLTRTGLDWTHRMETIAAQVAKLPANSCLLDGEIVVLRPDGNTSFADLQAAFQDGIKKPLTYFVFDLLHLNGHNLRNLPLSERKANLADLLAQQSPASGNSIRFTEHLEASGKTVFHKACELHAEGILSKRAAGKYIPGRSSNWLKLKCIREQEFVIGGFTLPAKGHTGLHGTGSLLLGYYENAPTISPRKYPQTLIYAGRTGTGFTQETHRILRNQLESLRTNTTPFHNPPAEARRKAIWVKPQLVAQVRFATWTADGLVRQASFKGLREDKPANEVRREEPAPKPSAAKHASHSTPALLAAKSTRTRNLVVPGEDEEPKPLQAKRTDVPKQETTAPTQAHAPVRLTHPEKILDAPSQLTKQQLADYYWAIAPNMLPHIANRPLTLVRCPDGPEHQCFYQRHVTPMLPSGIESVSVIDKTSLIPEPYITLSTPEALASLAQIGVLEIHPWGSRNLDLEHPDRIIIDLDPDPTVPWPTIAATATDIRNQLKKLGLESFLKSTGGKGLHVVIPIQPEHDWPVVKQFARAFVLQLEKSNPTLYLTKMTKAARKNRIYLDYLRNERGATAVAAFSPRARAGLPVALPLSWTDLKLPESPLFRVADFPTWKSRLRRDPWKQLPLIKQSLNPNLLPLV